MRFSRIAEGKELVDHFPGKDKTEVLFEEVQTGQNFIHPEGMGFMDQSLYFLSPGIIPVPQDVALAVFVPARKLHSRNESRISFSAYFLKNRTGFHRIMVRDRKKFYPRLFYPVKNLLRSVCSVRELRVHMKIDDFWKKHADL